MSASVPSQNPSGAQDTTTDLPPETGHLTTHEELEATGLNLQAWLNLTRDNALKIHDSWAEGNTNAAFSFNNCTGVERSHRDNDWNFFGIDLAAQGHATYTYMLRAPKLLRTLTDNTTTTTDKHDVWNNALSNVPTQFSTLYQRTAEKTVTISATQTSSLSVSTGMNIEGFSFSVSASFDTSNTQANTKTNSVVSQDTATATLPAGSSVDVDIVSTVRTKEMIYEVVFAIGSNNPEGSIAKATDRQDVWNKFFKIEDIAGDKVKSTARYKVTTTEKRTNIVISDAGHGPTPLAMVQDKHVGQPLLQILELHAGP